LIEALEHLDEQLNCLIKIRPLYDAGMRMEIARGYRDVHRRAA
jgi:hypothetical protein